MIIHTCEQGSDEWRLARLGKATASRFKDVLAKGQGKTRKAYMVDLAAEIITGEPTSSFTTKAMEWGTLTEPQARSMYEFENDIETEQVGFIELNQFIGVSPDSLVGDNGMLEIKCPNTATQIGYWLDRHKEQIPSTYKPQVQGQLWVAERDWCDFVTFDPRIKTEANYLCTRVFRDDEYIKTLEAELGLFIDDLKELLCDLGYAL